MIQFPGIAVFCLLGTFSFSQSKTVIDHQFSKKEVREDIEFLRKKLETNHPNLYLYTTKPVLDATFDSLANALVDSMTEQAVYSHITVLSSIIKDGHTLILPSEKLVEYCNKNSRFLPFHFSIIGDRLYAGMICTKDSSLAMGDELLQINNSSAAEIIGSLMKRQVRDGQNQTYPVWILNNYFRDYYAFIFGHPEELVIDYRRQGKTFKAVIRALPKDSIYYFRKSKYPAWSNLRKPGEGITVYLSPDHKYAVLTIKDFHKEILKNEFHQDFKEEIRNCFSALKKNGIMNLVLDIRNNQGGDTEYGSFLLSHLIGKPFKMLDGFYKLDHKNPGTLEPANGESTGVYKPMDDAFSGNLYVLINGGSFSNSGIVAACLKRNQRGIFIGEETGGNRKVIAGYANDYLLPNTKIRIEIPTRQFMLDGSMPLDGRGTIPDHKISLDAQQTNSSVDKAMNVAVGMIIKR